MRRKYDIRNKRNFVIILILSIAVICVFSLFIHKYRQSSKIEYLIETGSVVQDVNKNFINIEEDALLKKRWNDSYYLIYQDNKINLGKKVIVFNSITGNMKLYGTFYEIKDDGMIVDNNNETILENTASSKFYKLDDREYLLVDGSITSRDNNISADNYLLVELDKMGNAKLSNYKLDLKTINPTTLVTSKYIFDIANEILNFGKYDIDLKKIIGSTNQYKPEGSADDSESGDGTGGGGGTGTGGDGGAGNGTGTGSGTGGGTGDGVGTGTGGAGDIINDGGQGDLSDIGELKDKTKMTSVIRIIEGLSQIDIDYVVYDPYNEYKTVYAVVTKPDKIEKIYLSKNDTHLVIDKLLPDTVYNVKFVYAVNDDETEELVYNTFFEDDLKTKKPNYAINLDRISNVTNLLTFKVSLQENLIIKKINVRLSFEYKIPSEEVVGEYETIQVNEPKTIGVEGNPKNIKDSFDISKYVIDQNTVLTLTVDSVENEQGIIDINSVHTFRFGGNDNGEND